MTLAPSLPLAHPRTALQRYMAGPAVLGVAMVLFAIITVVSQKFWPPVPDDLPFRSVWLNVSAALMALTGTGLFFASTQPLSAMILAVLYAVFVLCFLPRVTGYPHLIGAWLGFAEHLAILAGALSIGLRASPGGATSAHLGRVIRIVFGLCAIVFGLSHVLSLPETIAIVPAWLPGPKAFWAVATATGHFAIALALILNGQVRWATRLGGAMYTVIGLLVWLPVILKAPGEGLPWNCLALSLALAGALVSLGEDVNANSAARDVVAR